MGETGPKRAFLDYSRTVKDEVDRALAVYFDDMDREHAKSDLIQDLAPMLRAVRALVERGGKRLRGVFLAAAYEACGGEDHASMVPALVSFELLQAYLLVHDDWIDDDDVRRGGPTVHAALRQAFGSVREAETCAVLAGDLAAAWSLGALCACAIPEARIARAARAMADVQRKVALGQMLDVRATVQRQGQNMRAAIDRVYELKTASYTVEGPLAIGAMLAGASEGRVDGLALVARPLGIMFQLKDDLLGVFGDPMITGKSDSNDLRQGKFTALIVEALDDPNVMLELVRLQKAHGDKTAAESADALVVSLRNRIVATGARERVEARILELYNEASVAIEAAEITPRGKELLLGAAAVIGGREQ
jgi:geranylgeranyl diphosphate synthase type I